MTTFAELLTNVYSLTNRADLVAESTLAVQAATLKAHQADDWIKDFAEYSIAFSTSDFYQTLDYKTIIPLWRKPRYIRKYDAVNSSPGDFFGYIVPEKVIDEYGSDRLDVFYVAGASIQIRSSTTFQYAILGCYLNPSVVAASFSSWIADDHPFAIIYEAVSIVFKTIGFDEQHKQYQALAMEARADLTKHAVTGIGN
jgi:hypothetical protein